MILKNVNMQIVDRVETPWSQLDDWQKKSHPYTCTLIYNGNTLETPFFTGPGWEKEPDWMDVLGALFSEADSFVSSRDFTDFCLNFGYDTDSIRALKIYESCERTAQALQDLLGDDFEEISDYLREEGY